MMTRPDAPALHALSVRMTPEFKARLRKYVADGHARSLAAAIISTSSTGLDVAERLAAGTLDDPAERQSIKERWEAAMQKKDVAAFTQSLTDAQWQAILAQHKLDEDAKDAAARNPIRSIGNAPPGMIHSANATRLINLAPRA